LPDAPAHADWLASARPRTRSSARCPLICWSAGTRRNSVTAGCPWTVRWLLRRWGPGYGPHRAAGGDK